MRRPFERRGKDSAWGLFHRIQQEQLQSPAITPHRYRKSDTRSKVQSVLDMYQNHNMDTPRTDPLSDSSIAWDISRCFDLLDSLKQINCSGLTDQNIPVPKRENILKLIDQLSQQSVNAILDMHYPILLLTPTFKPFIQLVTQDPSSTIGFPTKQFDDSEGTIQYLSTNAHKLQHDQIKQLHFIPSYIDSQSEIPPPKHRRHASVLQNNYDRINLLEYFYLQQLALYHQQPLDLDNPTLINGSFTKIQKYVFRGYRNVKHQSISFQIQQASQFHRTQPSLRPKVDLISY